MAASPVEIANIALTMLSTNRITDFNQNSESARRVNAVYDTVRDFMFDSHNWNFARRQANLSLLDKTPVLDWTYAFQVPPDCVRVLRMSNDAKYARYGDELYTDQDTAKIEYITNAETMFSPSFTLAFAAQLALILSYGITQSSTQTQITAATAEQLMKEAKWADAQDGQGIEPLHGSFIDERGG